MATQVTKPWLECVSLHPDVLSESFSEDIFALDLGPLADYLLGKKIGRPEGELPKVPPVYRDPDSFFNASFLTSGLKSLLTDVLGRLSGAPGNKVLKLVTPFGGGKSHTLAALLHGSLSRSSLDALPEASGLARPKDVRVAVVDGQYFDANVGKRVPGTDSHARTMWAWIAWSLGGQEAFDEFSEYKVAPGADEIVRLLQGGPSVILLDEILEYLISAGGKPIKQTTLRDETLSFLKRLTVAVGNVDNAVMVFSLQSSKRESLEYTNLLDTVDHLAARKDQRREPVEKDEILSVIQRRLLAKTPDATAASAAGQAYQDVFTRMRRAYAQSDAERQQAEEDGLQLRDRIRSAYPFHPGLIDLMRERWAAIPDFQRTRGALRFLAACLRAAHRAGKSRLLLGPGDVLIHDQEVRLAFFKEVGQREDLQACMEHDFVGANARTRRIDERRAREVTSEAGKQPATRLATTMLMHSFGALKREGGSESDLLPPGVNEQELFDMCVGPDLDSTTANACIKELKDCCLYLHFDGVRYCFKKDPNITLLVEQEADVVARDEAKVQNKIKDLLEDRLAGHPEAVIWPPGPDGIDDKEPRFLVAYLSFQFGRQPGGTKEDEARQLFEKYKGRNRDFRNGLALAVPGEDQIEILRRSVRYLVAIERIRNKWRELNLTDAQKGQLKEREATEKAATESALLKLYSEVWLPKFVGGKLDHDSVAVGGRPLQTTLDEKKRALVHERVMELITTVQKKVFGTLVPGKIPELFKLGEGEPPTQGIKVKDVVAGFYSFLGYPRLVSAEVVGTAIAKGVEKGLFAYVTGEPKLGDDGRYQVDVSRIAYQRHLDEDEVDLDSGFIMVPGARPMVEEPPLGPGPGGDGGPQPPGGGGGGIPEPPGGPTTGGGECEPPAGGAVGEKTVRLCFSADRDTLFNAWPALSNLADLAGTLLVTVEAESEDGMDQNKLENGVLEPLRELELIDE